MNFQQLLTPRLFIEEALQNGHARSYGLLMGFSREAVDFWSRLTEIDPTGITFYYVRQQIAKDERKARIWQEYTTGKKLAREKLRVAAEKIIDESYEEVKEELRKKIEGGNFLNSGEIFYNPKTGEIPHWDELKRTWMDKRWTAIGGTSYTSSENGPKRSLQIYRKIREASRIAEIVKRLKDKYQY